jgi:hypothetical protein
MPKKACRNCNKSFHDYKEFKIHIKECNESRMTIGDIMKEEDEY